MHLKCAASYLSHALRLAYARVGGLCFHTIEEEQRLLVVSIKSGIGVLY